MFVPEIRLYDWDAFHRQAIHAKACVAKLDMALYTEALTLQCFDGTVVWKYELWGAQNIADFFGAEMPIIESFDRKAETYDQFQLRRLNTYREWFRPHFEGQLLASRYEEGHFTNVVLIASELQEE